MYRDVKTRFPFTLPKTVVLGLCARVQMFLSIKKELARVVHVLRTRSALVGVYLLAVAFAAGVLTFIRVSADTPVVSDSPRSLCSFLFSPPPPTPRTMLVCVGGGGCWNRRVMYVCTSPWVSASEG